MALSEKQLKAIDLLIRGELKKGEIAKECGVSSQTLCFWQNDADFRKTLHESFLEVDSEYRVSRLKATRRLAEKGLDELERRFTRGEIKKEKTKDILDVVIKLLNNTNEENNNPSKQPIVNVNVTASDRKKNDQKTLDKPEFRDGLRDLLTKTGVEDGTIN